AAGSRVTGERGGVPTAIGPTHDQPGARPHPRPTGRRPLVGGPAVGERRHVGRLRVRRRSHRGGARGRPATDQGVEVTGDVWPALPLEEWRDTHATLHMWTQIVGKLALGLSPLTNHYWNTALQITSRGLATLPLTVDRRLITVTFDFVSHQLAVESSDGGHATVPLAPRPVAEFYRLVMDALARLDVRARIWTMPVEVPNPVRFEAVLEPAFYAYAYHGPPGCPDAVIAPGSASYDIRMHEWILPYEAVRRAPDPDATLLEFAQSTYGAAADLAKWDRNALERSG